MHSSTKSSFPISIRLSDVFLMILCLWVQPSAHADEPTSGELRYWKGNLHTHSLWSDGDDFPEMIAEWYRTHGYNFLALSDHNVLSQSTRWMSVEKVLGRGGKDVLDKYFARFGNHWVETRGEPGTQEHEVRLKPLDEFRHLLDQRGRFIMVQGEEVSDRAEGVPIHMNASNLLEVIEPQGGTTVREVMANNLRAVESQAKQLGRQIMMHLNHPNFAYAITAEDLAAVTEERFFEVYNGHPAVGHRGDNSHPGVERLWDIANTIRISELRAEPLLGIATDDSHNYHGKPGGSRVGRGWVMVRARFLTPEHLITALRKGDFYASSGVTISQIEFDSKPGVLKVSVEAEPGETYSTQFIGTRKGYDSTSEERTGKGRLSRKYSDQIGAVLQTTSGTSATYQFKGDELYVRAVVTSSATMSDPTFEDQPKQAWTQPVQLGD